MKRIVTLLISLIFLLAPLAKADEGMWLLPLLEKLNMGTMTEMGLKLSAEEIYSINQPSLRRVSTVPILYTAWLSSGRNRLS